QAARKATGDSYDWSKYGNFAAAQMSLPCDITPPKHQPVEQLNNRPPIHHSETLQKPCSEMSEPMSPMVHDAPEIPSRFVIGSSRFSSSASAVPSSASADSGGSTSYSSLGGTGKPLVSPIKPRSQAARLSSDGKR
ncbi:unnamed protein product, partial [Sphacelaria rigidula]